MVVSLKELIEHGIVFPALLPRKNDYLFNENGKRRIEELVSAGEEAIGRFHDMDISMKIGLLDLSLLDRLAGYTVNILSHDYTGRTPSMWNDLYEKFGLNIRNFMVVGKKENLKSIVDAFRSDPKYLGGGASAGFKEIVMPLLDELVPGDINSANAIVKSNGKLIGYNTDADGLFRSLEEKLVSLGSGVRGRKFLVVGAGGVAQQFVRHLINNGVSYVTIVNRTVEKAVNMALKMNQEYRRDIAEAKSEDEVEGLLLSRDCAAIVNTSEKGGDKIPYGNMFYAVSEDSEFRARELIRKLKTAKLGLVYVDITLPKSGKPNSLRILEEEGIDKKYIVDGIPMVVYQAVPVYKRIEKSHLKEHNGLVLSESEVLDTFLESQGMKK